MRQSLDTIRERVLVALRAACAQSEAMEKLLEQLEKVDGEIFDALRGDVEESNAWSRRSRARLERSVAEARQALNGGIWEVVSYKPGKPACQDDTCCWNKDGFCAASMEKEEDQCAKQKE